MYYLIIFYLLSSLVVASAGLVIMSKNPVYSVLFLILCFCNSAGLLFLINLEFLAISLIIIYVGAVIVLFLFVILMLNLKLTEIKSDSTFFIRSAFCFTLLFTVELFSLFRLEMTTLNLNSYNFFNDFSNYSLFQNYNVLNLNSETNLQKIGFLLFENF